MFAWSNTNLTTKNLDYKIRINNSYIPIDLGPQSPIGLGSFYSYNGFLALQTTIDNAFIHLIQNHTASDLSILQLIQVCKFIFYIYFIVFLSYYFIIILSYITLVNI